jgi:small subunit ribosomal protein S6
MADSNVNLYEGMFLFNLQAIGGELSAALSELEEILSRAEAEVIAITRWDERRLAYEIRGQKRGLYLMAYFKARGSQIANIERDVNLSENLLRCLIVKGEHLGEVELDRARAEAQKLRDTAALSEAPGEAAPAAESAGEAEAPVEVESAAASESAQPSEPEQS